MKPFVIALLFIVAVVNAGLFVFCIESSSISNALIALIACLFAVAVLATVTKL